MANIASKLDAEQRLVEIVVIFRNLLLSHANGCEPRGSIADAMSKDEARYLADEIQRLHIFFDPTFEIGGFTADECAKIEESLALRRRGE